MKVNGACLCGQIKYEAEIDPDRVAICHCRDCQVNAATAFGLVAGVIDRQFALLTGTLKEYEKIAQSGRTRILSFCGDCGTRIHARTEGDANAFFGLRVGSIAERDQLTPKSQVWCESALPWVADMAAIPKVWKQSS